MLYVWYIYLYAFTIKYQPLMQVNIYIYIYHAWIQWEKNHKKHNLDLPISAGPSGTMDPWPKMRKHVDSVLEI